MKIVAVAALVMLVGGSAGSTDAQSQQQDSIKSVAAAGHLNGDSSEYQNNYFGVTVRLPEPNTRLVLNSVLAENRAILLEAVNIRGADEQRHNFVIVTHSAYFSGHPVSVTEFVRSAREQLEREGLHSIRSEATVRFAGQTFVESDLMRKSKDETYFKAIIFTRMKGYMFGFWVEAPTKEQLKKLADLDGKITFR